MNTFVQALNTLVNDPQCWEHGELCMGEVYNIMSDMFSDMDPADFEYEFVCLEDEYYKEAA